MSEPFLLDTHVLVWTVSEDPKLSDSARRAMPLSIKALSVSAVSVWEILMKHPAGKLHFPVPSDVVVDQILHRSPWSILAMNSEHLPELLTLPRLTVRTSYFLSAVRIAMPS